MCTAYEVAEPADEMGAFMQTVPDDYLTMLAHYKQTEGASTLKKMDTLNSLESAYSGFKCKCASKHRDSCIDELKKSQLRAAYCVLNPVGYAQGGPTALRRRLHRVLWQKKVPLKRPNSRGHNFKVDDWSYDGTSLCRAGWMRLMGGTYQAHRDMYAAVLRGISPTEAECENGTALLQASAQRVVGHATEKQAFATCWLNKNYLNTMEFMPNENKIVLRGVGLTTVHAKQYSAPARLAGCWLSYKSFAACLPAAAVACAREQHDADPAFANAVKVGRSARHSRFPMCSTCLKTQQDYIAEASNPLADKTEVERLRNVMLDHQALFMNDRRAARSLRMATYFDNCDDSYECDDKCGSHWCKAPVTAGGRDSKEYHTRNYEFAVQANVVCGPYGVMRLSIIPKNLGTGSNFGLSTLLLGLHSAWRIGKIPKSARRLLRHTDGGPDNVAKLTHIFHWLLVYIGCWEDVVWFMFNAGHSHTEIADRLFALMKKLFETDSSSHVEGGIQSFEELEEKLKDTFSKCQEMKEIVYHFANWDVDGWLKAAVRFKKDDLKMITTAKVYRYEYVGDAPCKNRRTGQASNMAIEHGGVRVTFKTNLSDVKVYSNDDEWAPVRRVEEVNAGGENLVANRTTDEGVLFVSAPPDLTSEPAREELPQKTCKEAWNDCNKVLQRADVKSSRAIAHWHALQAMHGSSGLATGIPVLPCSVTVMADESAPHGMKAGLPQPLAGTGAPGGGAQAGADEGFKFEFRGAPCLMKPLLQDMVRFKRPFITWDIWSAKPPLTFPSVPRDKSEEGQLREEVGEQDADAAVQNLRSPAARNTVRHLGNAKEYDAARRRHDAEEWAEGDADEDDSNDSAKVIIRKGDLCIVHIDIYDGEMALGLACITNPVTKLGEVEKEGAVTEGAKAKGPYVEISWFQRKSRRKFAWPANPTFEWWPRPPKKSKGKGKSSAATPKTTWIGKDSILMVVEKADLTRKSSGDDVRLIQPRLTSHFMAKLRILAKKRRLWKASDAPGNSGVQRIGEEEGGEEEEEEEEEEEGEEEDMDPEYGSMLEGVEELEFRMLNGGGLPIEGGGLNEPTAVEEDDKAAAEEAVAVATEAATVGAAAAAVIDKEIMEVQSCGSNCDYPCRIPCVWDKCTIIEEISAQRVKVRMEDNGEVIPEVLRRSIRKLPAIPEGEECGTSLAAKRPRRGS